MDCKVLEKRDNADMLADTMLPRSARGWNGYQKERPSMGLMYGPGTQLYPIPAKGDYVIFRERLYSPYVHRGKNSAGEKIMFEPMQRYMTEDGRDIVYEVEEVHTEKGLRNGYIIIHPVFPPDICMIFPHQRSCVQARDLAYGLMIFEKVVFTDGMKEYDVVDDGRKMIIDGMW